MKHPTIALMAVLAGTLLAGPANAGLITGITLEDWDGTTPNYPNMGPLKAINGEGLPGGAPALSGTHGATWTQHWYSSIKAGAWITVDLEGNYAVDTIHLWNENENNAGRFRGMKNVKIYVSPDENVANLVKLTTDGTGAQDNGSGDFLFPIGEGLITYTGFDIDLSGVTNASLLGNARLIRFQNIDNHGSNGGSGLAEVQFGGVVAPEETATFQLTITPNASTPGNYDFSWDSQDGKVYDLVSATDLSTVPDTWPVYLGNENIPGTAPTNTLMDVAGGGGPARFFAMIEKDPPPLFSEDFEADDGGFTVATTQGTDWAHGTPDSSGLGGSVTEGNDGSTNCWGTNLGAWAGGAGDPGFYADPTDTCLRSAVIDLTGVTAAELTFAQALDLEAGDTVTVNIIDDTTDTVVSADIVSITDTDDSTANWESIGPVAIPGPSLGQAVRIEWCLSGVGGATDDYMGWYIDDITVTDTSP